MVASLQTAFAIALGVVATVMLSLAKSSITSRSVIGTIFSKQTGFGLGAGAFLGFCTVAYGAALKHMPAGDVMLNAGLAAAIAVTIQTVGFGAWLYALKRHELVASLVYWREISSQTSIYHLMWSSIAVMATATKTTLVRRKSRACWPSKLLRVKKVSPVSC